MKTMRLPETKPQDDRSGLWSLQLELLSMAESVLGHQAVVQTVPSAALLGAGGARDADVAEQVLPGDTSPPELKLLGLGVHPGDALLEAAAGADVSVDLCHAPEFTLMQRLPQHGNDSLFALFHTPRLWNDRYNDGYYHPWENSAS